jgi:NADH-quinone oxidoreductase chain G
MILIKINGLEFLSKPSISILEACKNIGITIPRFCYHEMLSISGNCRMCLVEIENMEKPVASCVTEVEDNMSIKIDSPFVKKARENIVETLLLNHPLDCPICDQAGECDLQDQTKGFGSSHSRFFFKKKTVEDKYCGPLIKTIMTRCITCTRCVRYAEEIAGVNYFGTFNRGSGTEIGSYVVKMFDSEISGNVIDLCPVGALTSKPYAFKARPWELRLAESIDTMDSFGSNIYLNYKETEILRILPKSNSDINETLISDKIRFSYDSNNINRIKNIHIYNNKNQYYDIATWNIFFKTIDNVFKIENNNFYSLLNQEMDLKSIITLKSIKNFLQKNFILNDSDSIYNSSNLYVNHQTNVIQSLENLDDLVLFLGTNLRLESSILNARIRSKYRNSHLSSVFVGNQIDSNIPSRFLTLNLKNVINVIEGRCNLLSPLLYSSSNIYTFVSANLSNRIINIDCLLSDLKKVFSNLNIIYVYHSCNSEGLKFLNIQRKSILKSIQKDTCIAINVKENYSTKKSFSLNKKNNIYIGTHGSISALKASYILPTKTSFETSFTYLSYEHRAQKTAEVIKNVNEARSIDQIILSLFFKDVKKLPINKYLSHIEETSNYPEKYNTIKTVSLLRSLNYDFNFYNRQTKLYKYPIKQMIRDYYLSSRLCNFSKIMLECSKELRKNYTNFIS